MFERSFDSESLARFAAVEGLASIARKPINERMQRIADLLARSTGAQGSIVSYRYPRTTWEHCGSGPFEPLVHALEPDWLTQCTHSPTAIAHDGVGSLYAVALHGLDDKPAGCLTVFMDEPTKLDGGALASLADCAGCAETELRVEALHNNQTQLLEELYMARQQALQDSLTRLWNRQALSNLLERELARAYRENTGIGLIFVDIDHFSSLNDTHGRAAGDDVIQHVTGILSRAVRQYDALGRYGGEEFLILLPNCPPDVTRKVAERMRTAVASEPVPTESGYLPVTISLGVASCGDGAIGYSPESLLQAADKAVIKSKRAGRNAVSVAEASDYHVA